MNFLNQGNSQKVNQLETQLAEKASQKIAEFHIENYPRVSPEADDTGRLNRAIDAAIPVKGAVILPKGTFTISTGINKTGSFSIIGEGEQTVILSTDTTNSILKVINNHGSLISNLKLKGTATVRNSSNYGLYVQTSERVLIQNVFIESSGAAGMYLSGLKDSKVVNCDVRNTLADGIHVTYVSKNVVISGNNLLNTGDDGIATVSYQSDLDRCTQIVITGNFINSSKARGIANVGSNDIIISNNFINGTASSGILVVLDATYNTFVPTNTTISGNQVVNAGTVTPTKGNLFGIEVAGAIGTIIENNIVRNSATRGINIGGSRNIIRGNKCSGNTSNQVENQSGVIIEGNRFEENGTYGIYLTNLTDSSITNNVFYNNSANGVNASSNATLNACSRCTFVNNDIIDDRGTVQIANTFTLNGCTNITVGSNKENAGAKTFNAPSTTGITTLDPLSGAYTPNGSNIYVTGTMFTRTDTNQILTHMGSGVWKAVTVA